MDIKAALQECEYSFPYHYIPNLSDGMVSCARFAGWGIAYVSVLERVINIIKSYEFNSLIDVGCGDGRLLYELYKIYPAKRLVGLDNSETPLRFARAFSPDIQFICGDISDSHFHSIQRFEIAILIEVLEHIPPDSYREFTAGLGRILDDKGKLVITVPTELRPITKKHYQHFNEYLLDDILGDVFILDSIQYLNKRSKLTYLIQIFLENRFLVLSNPKLISALYKLHLRSGFDADVTNGLQLLAIYSRKS